MKLDFTCLAHGLGLVSAVLPFVHAAPLTGYSVFEKLPTIPEGYTELSTPVAADRKIALRIHLRQKDASGLERRLLEISDPEHASYGQHMSREHVEQLLAPKESSVKLVQDWLRSFDLDQDLTVEGQWIKLNLEVSQVEKMLQTKYSLFKDTQSKKERTVLRTLEYSLPNSLHNAVDFIQPTIMFGMRPLGSSLDRIFTSVEEENIATEQSKLLVGSTFNITACNKTITPDCLANLYGFNDYTPVANSKLGITGYLEEYAQFDDLEVFLQNYAPSKVGNNFTWESINGGLLTQDYSNVTVNSTFPDYGEANLDIQYTVGISAPIPNVFYSTGGLPPSISDIDVHHGDSEPYLELLTTMLLKADSELPQTLTTSYGENEQTIPDSYARTVCGMFAQLGARGVSIIFSSGDSGPGWSCKSNDGKGTPKFLAQFPASCPWVTSVGGVTHVEPENAVSFSAGGFSEKFPMPHYQAKQVSHYYRHTSDWKNFEQYFHKGGRGFPDVSGQAYGYTVMMNNVTKHYQGTSCSAPMFAGIVSLLNSDLISRGKRPLGFLNPWIYSQKTACAWNDITTGESTGCNGLTWGSPIPVDPKLGAPAIIPGARWIATPGWDPVTGLGTPNFPELLKSIR